MVEMAEFRERYLKVIDAMLFAALTADKGAGNPACYIVVVLIDLIPVELPVSSKGRVI